MECRICFEENNLLQNVCKCKGSQQYIHLNCLIKIVQHLHTNKCPTCNQDYNFNPTEPRLWKYLGSSDFEFLLKIFHLCFFQYDQYMALRFAYYNNLFLMCLYTYAYFPRLKFLTTRDLYFWLQPYIYYNNSYYFPLFILFYIVFTYHNGLLLIFYLPYKALFEVQKLIDETFLRVI
jgi:hypothetical protein